MMVSNPTIAYLAEGKLHVVAADGADRQIESPFIEQMLERRERDRQNKKWRASGMMWNVTNAAEERAFDQAAAGDGRRVRFTSVAPGAGETLLYTIDTDTITGLFERALDSDDERRLVHKQGFALADLSRHPTTGRLAGSVRSADASANLIVTDADGGKPREVTEGDAMDEAPAWAPGAGERLVYQSAGIGRDAHGGIYGLAPYIIQELDLDRGRLDTLLEDERFDLLMPRLSADGALYFIRRPYQLHPGASVGQRLLDVVLFPYRLIRAFIAFFNVFSVMFSRKPLITAGGPEREGPDQAHLLLHGRLVDAQRALRQARQGADVSLVPANWELVRRMPDGETEVIAPGVLTFDLGPDGSVIYSNGVAIRQQAANGEVSLICRGRLIERVIALGDSATLAQDGTV